VRPRIEYIFSWFRQPLKTGNHRMLTLHVVQARLGYGIGYINFADKEGLVLYLLTRGITDENIMKALEGLVRHGAYTIQQESSSPRYRGCGRRGTEGDPMNTAQQYQRKIAGEVRSIRDELHHIGASLHPDSDVNQRAVAEKKIKGLETRIAY
jgi:hypothetical protein